jgi:type IV secretory pathway TrbD component
MTRYRPRAVLWLFLVLNLTACQTWHSVSTASPNQFIEAEQPDRVRVTTQDGIQVELERPSVESDELVALGDRSVPLADIALLGVQEFSLWRTVLAGYGLVTGAVAVALALGFSFATSDPGRYGEN